MESKERKYPPIEKFAEAYSVIADGRIKELDSNTFIIKSSNGEKEYKVVENGNYFRSNDNATKFVRYAGYPILATLMYKEILPLPKLELLKKLADVDWNAINKKFKRDYAGALEHVLEDKGFTEIQKIELKDDMYKCFEQFKELEIRV